MMIILSIWKRNCIFLYEQTIGEQSVILGEQTFILELKIVILGEQTVIFGEQTFISGAKTVILGEQTVIFRVQIVILGE